MPVQCFQIDEADNVATLLQDAAESTDVVIRGDAAGNPAVRVIQPIQSGHKIAVTQIAQGARVIKYGCPIGEATQPIAPGEWVHLHNCRSLYDSASSSLDIESGSRKETRYA